MPSVSSIYTALARIWTRDSRILLGGFFVTVLLIIYIWWPLAEEYFAYVDWNGEWWRYIDWLLIGIFGFMSVTIIARADLKTDLLIIFVACAADWQLNPGARRQTCGIITPPNA